MDGKLSLIFTLDYEIHGNGDGSPYKLMVEPTERLMNIMDEYGAKLTIFADVAEIIKFYEYKTNTGNDKFYYNLIEKQLQDAIKRGHDVQLHIHSSYFNSKYNEKSWEQCWEEYNLAGMSYEYINEKISICKSFLENMLVKVNPDYKVYMFRASNWSMHPSENIIKALINNGIYNDSSVYKFGKQSGWVNFDYTSAFSNYLFYRASNENICNYNQQSDFLEFPIYSEQKNIFSFITPIRLLRLIRAKLHKHKNSKRDINEKNKDILRFIRKIFMKHPWKLDFNQATSRQIIKALNLIIKEKKHASQVIPVVLIGHSKSFIRYNEVTFKKLLKHIINYPKQYEFTLFKNLLKTININWKY